jgi:hypothetical protein
MIQALLHGKLSREQENMEDILTSIVFGVLRYLPIEDGLLPFLRKSLMTDGEPGILSDIGKDAHAVYQFWPTLKERVSQGGIEFECHACEPDLLLKIYRAGRIPLYVLVEAKLSSGKSSGPSDESPAPYDQLAREWDNLVCLAQKEGAEPLLIFLTSDFGIPADQIRESRNEYLQKRPGSRFACGWLTWRQSPSVFRDNPDARLQDLVKLCERLDLRFFDRAIRMESVPHISWRFRPGELRFEWLSGPLVAFEWRYTG